MVGAAPAPGSIRAQTAPVTAPSVAVLAADLGPMARIELSWPSPFHARGEQDDRRLHLEFDQDFNTPFIGALRQRLGHWIDGIDKRARSLTLTTREPVYFNVQTLDNTLVIEITARPSTVAGSTLTAPASAATAPRLTPPSVARVAVPPARNSALDPSAQQVLRHLRMSDQAFQNLVGGVSATDSRSGPSVSEMLLVATVDSRPTSQGMDLNIHWPAPVTLETRTKGRELVLRLDVPVDGSLAEEISRTVPDWLESASAGYDSLLLVAARPVSFDVVHSGADTRISMISGATAPDSNAPDRVADNEDIRLDVLRARLKARTGSTSAAREDLQNLRQTAPENTEVLVELASLEESVGAWQRAVSLYDRALSINPERRDLVTARRSLRKQHGPRIRIDADGQFVQDGDTQYIVTAEGRTLPSQDTEVGFRVENRYLDDDVVVRARNGATQAVSIMRQRGELYGAIELAPGHTVEGALLASGATPGGAVRYDFRTPASVTSLSMDYHRTYWELVEGIVDDGTQDRLALRHEHQLSRQWRAEGQVSLNRYGIADIDTAATTVEFTGAIRYLLPWEAADLTLGYSLSARYIGTLETRRDGNGNAFNPMPLTDTEIHSLDFALGDALGADWRYAVFGGVAMDRFGGVGPSLAGELFWEPEENIELGLRAGHSRISGRGDDAVFTRFGGHLLIRF